MKDFGTLLSGNLMELNAKERDHLMRFAYLGDESTYDQGPKKWISEPLYNALRAKLSVKDGAIPECIFAGMDYHLDWLHAALSFACRGCSVVDACAANREETFRLSQQVYDDGPYTGASLCPVIGGNEDLDLLVVFRQGEVITMFVIEAKGVAKVNKEQLARKLIRLDRIMEASGAKEHLDRFECKFVWVAPKALSKSIKGSRERESYTRLRDCASEYVPLEPIVGRSEIGDVDIDFIPLEGFPKSLAKVTRIDRDDTETSDRRSSRTYRKWMVETRWKSKQ